MIDLVTILPIWILILVAFIAANLPFLNYRLLGLFVELKNQKSLWFRFFELLLMYLMVGGFAKGLEYYFGQNNPQTWAFYVVTIALFVIFSFPGFVYRYLLR